MFSNLRYARVPYIVTKLRIIDIINTESTTTTTIPDVATFFYTRWPTNLALILPSTIATRSASNATQCKFVLATCSLVGEQLAPWSVSNAKPACPSQYPHSSSKNSHCFGLPAMSRIWNLSGCACNVLFNVPFFKRLLSCSRTGG